MAISLYDITVPVYIRQVKNLVAVLEKAQKWCDDNSKPYAELVGSRLAPDMEPLHFQVRAFATVAFNGVITPEWSWMLVTPDTPPEETTLEGLFALLQKRLDWLQSVKKEDVDGNETKPIDFWTGSDPNKAKNFKFDTAEKYVGQFAFPNFFFHETMTYALCRMVGVPLGKADFLAAGGPFE